MFFSQHKCKTKDGICGLGGDGGTKGWRLSGKEIANKGTNLRVHSGEHLMQMRIPSGGMVRWGKLLKISCSWLKNGLFEMRKNVTFLRLKMQYCWYDQLRVEVSFNPSVPALSLLGDFTSESHGGGPAEICHQQCVQEQGPRKKPRLQWELTRVTALVTFVIRYQNE